MKARWTAVGVAIAIVGIATGYFASPYWALHQLRNAAADGEGDRVATYVDFPAVRDSLKVQFAAAMARRAEGSNINKAFAGLGQAFAMQMVNGVVDAAVSPETISAMIRSGKTPRALLPETKKATPTSSDKERAPPRVRQHYATLDTFEAALVDPVTNDDTLIAVLTRQGLFSWKLTAVRLPALVKG